MYYTLRVAPSDVSKSLNVIDDLFRQARRNNGADTYSIVGMYSTSSLNFIKVVMFCTFEKIFVEDIQKEVKEKVGSLSTFSE